MYVSVVFRLTLHTECMLQYQIRWMRWDVISSLQLFFANYTIDVVKLSPRYQPHLDTYSRLLYSLFKRGSSLITLELPTSKIIPTHNNSRKTTTRITSGCKSARISFLIPLCFLSFRYHSVLESFIRGLMIRVRVDGLIVESWDVITSMYRVVEWSVWIVRGRCRILR